MDDGSQLVLVTRTIGDRARWWFAASWEDKGLVVMMMAVRARVCEGEGVD